MDGDTEIVLKAISDLAGKVETYHGDFREFRGSYQEKVETIEEQIKSDKFWQRVQMVCVVPIVGVGHQILAHFGWIK